MSVARCGWTGEVQLVGRPKSVLGPCVYPVPGEHHCHVDQAGNRWWSGGVLEVGVWNEAVSEGGEPSWAAQFGDGETLAAATLPELIRAVEERVKGILRYRMLVAR